MGAAGAYMNFATAMQPALSERRLGRCDTRYATEAERSNAVVVIAGRNTVSDLTHLDDQGRARMVDVSDKDITKRRALAGGVLRMAPSTLRRIMDGDLPKGDVLGVARTAAIMAA